MNDASAAAEAEDDHNDTERADEEVYLTPRGSFTREDAISVIHKLRKMHQVESRRGPESVYVGLSLIAGTCTVDHVVSGTSDFKGGLKQLLQRGDEIVSVNNSKVSPDTVIKQLKAGRMGSKVTVGARKGKDGDVKFVHLKRQDGAKVEAMIHVEQALAKAFHACTKDNHLYENLQSISQHVASLGKVIDSQEEHLSKRDRCLALHVSALESEILKLCDPSEGLVSLDRKSTGSLKFGDGTGSNVEDLRTELEEAREAILQKEEELQSVRKALASLKKGGAGNVTGSKLDLAEASRPAELQRSLQECKKNLQDCKAQAAEKDKLLEKEKRQQEEIKKEIARLNGSIADKDKSLEESKRITESLRMNLDALKQHDDSVSKKAGAEGKKSQDLQKSMDAVQKNLAESEAELSAARNKLTVQAQVLGEMKKSEAVMKEKTAQQASGIDKVRNESAAMVKELSALKEAAKVSEEKKSEWADERQRSRSALAGKAKELENAQANCKQLEKEIANLQKRLEQQESAMKGMKQDSGKEKDIEGALRKELESLKALQSQKNVEIRALRSAEEGLKKEVQENRSQIEGLKNSRKEREQEVQALKTEIECIRKKSNGFLVAKDEEIGKMKGQIEALNRDIQAYKTGKEQAGKQIEALTKEREALKKDVEAIKKVADRVKEVEEWKKKAADKERLLEEERKQAEGMKEELGSVRKEMDAIKERANSILSQKDKEAKKTSAELTAIKNELEELKKREAEGRQTGESLRKEIAVIRDRANSLLGQKDSELQKAQASMKVLRAQLEAAQTKTEELESVVKQANACGRELQIQMDVLQKQCSDKEKLVSSLRDEIKGLEEKQNTFAEERQRSRSALTSKTKELEAAITQKQMLETEIAKHEAAVQQSEQALQELKRDSNKDLSDSRNKTGELEAKKKELEEEVQALKLEIEGIRKLSNGLLSAKDEEIGKMKRHIDSLNRDIQTHKSDKEQLSKKVEEMTKEREALRRDMEALKKMAERVKEVDQWKRKAAEKDKFIEEGRAREQGLKRELGKVKESSDALINKTESAFARISREKDSAMMELAELRRREEQGRMMIQDLKKEVKTVRENTTLALAQKDADHMQLLKRAEAAMRSAQIADNMTQDSEKRSETLVSQIMQLQNNMRAQSAALHHEEEECNALRRKLKEKDGQITWLSAELDGLRASLNKQKRVYTPWSALHTARGEEENPPRPFVASEDELTSKLNAAERLAAERTGRVRDLEKMLGTQTEDAWQTAFVHGDADGARQMPISRTGRSHSPPTQRQYSPSIASHGGWATDRVRWDDEKPVNTQRSERGVGGKEMDDASGRQRSSRRHDSYGKDGYGQGDRRSNNSSAYPILASELPLAEYSGNKDLKNAVYAQTSRSTASSKKDTGEDALSRREAELWNRSTADSAGLSGRGLLIEEGISDYHVRRKDTWWVGSSHMENYKKTGDQRSPRRLQAAPKETSPRPNTSRSVPSKERNTAQTIRAPQSVESANATTGPGSGTVDSNRPSPAVPTPRLALEFGGTSAKDTGKPPSKNFDAKKGESAGTQTEQEQVKTEKQQAQVSSPHSQMSSPPTAVGDKATSPPPRTARPRSAESKRTPTRTPRGDDDSSSGDEEGASGKRRSGRRPRSALLKIGMAGYGLFGEVLKREAKQRHFQELNRDAATTPHGGDDAE